MPELPEVETIRRGLAPLVSGRTVIEAGAHPSVKFQQATAATGRRIKAVDRRGKYLLFHLDSSDRLVIHLGMTGQLRVTDTEPDLDPYVRAWWRLDQGGTLIFKDVRRFGRVAVVGTDLSGLPTLRDLGPEPFDPAFSPEHLWAALRQSRVRVKTQLLNQRVVAGVGNIYADEALWRAGVHPGARAVSRPAATRLRDSIVDVLAEGIAHGGTTLRDYRTASGEVGQNQHHLDCYGRSGQPCHRCDAVLARSVVDGRGTTRCPQCQRR